MMAIAARAAAGVRAERLLAHHRDLAAIGALGTGLSREALTDADLQARELVRSWADGRGYRLAMDAIGNAFIRRPGRDEGLDPVVTGSHIDSQPAGGAYDGAFGVLAAFEVLEALDDAGIATRRPVEAVIWTNEEGSRFQPTTMGSAGYVGRLPLDQILAARDSAGVTMDEALHRLLTSSPPVDRRALGAPIAAYIEAHIEQGPILEATGIPIGVVTAILGLRWFTVRVTGQAAHAGTTPRSGRRDALMAAVAMIGRLSDLMADPSDIVRFTVGRFEVRPNSPNTIPDRVLFTVDFRHPDAAVLARLGDQVAPICLAGAMGCSVSVEETMSAAPTVLDAGITDRIRQVSRALGYDQADIVSGATHDAKYVALTCPAGMVFIPCRDGVSHTVLEHAEPDHMVAGTRVLAGAISELAME
jgi:beta-ureidopropionase / N-carbamoyl-L-amino-acid hydrolase